VQPAGPVASPAQPTGWHAQTPDGLALQSGVYVVSPDDERPRLVDARTVQEVPPRLQVTALHAVPSSMHFRFASARGYDVLWPDA